MGRIVTLSMAVLMIVGGTGAVFSETVNQDSVQVAQTRGVPNPDAPPWSQLDPGLHYVGPAGSNLRGEPVFVPPGYARSTGGGIPNPDAPSWSQLDPGLHYVGP
jgi:hypothetical protein